MSNFPALTERVAGKRAEVQQVRRTLELLEVELRVWESALSLVTDGNFSLSQTESTGTIGKKIVSQDLFNPTAGAKFGKRGMNAMWKEIAFNVSELYPNAFNLDQLSEAAELSGHKIPRATLRSQMANYAKVGLIERISVGVFRLTDTGRAAAGVLSVEKIEPPSV